MITVRKARQLLASYAGRKVLVVGDLMLDRYVSGAVHRISPEAPVPIVHIDGERAVPGGAANVAMNIRALGGRPILAGVVGADADGAELKSVLRKNGIATDGVIADAGVQTTVKTRILAERQQVVRVDREGPPTQLEKALRRLRAKLPALVRKAEGVAIEDYGKGVICQGVVDCVLSAVQAAGIPVGLDPKDNHALAFSHLTLATPNYAEACSAAGLKPAPLGGNLLRHEMLRAAGNILLESWHCDLLIITLGAHGMYLRSRGMKPRVIPARAQEVFDVSGAGDTVIAATLLGLASGASYEEAAGLANYAAGVVVGKVGTATCTPKELLAHIK